MKILHPGISIAAWSTPAARTLVVAVAAATVLALPGPAAEARINEQRIGDLAVECGGLQDEFDSLQRQLHDPKTTNAAKAAISGRLAEITEHWNAVCRGTYGAIAARTLPQGQDLTGTTLQTLGPGESGPARRRPPGVRVPGHVLSPGQ